MSKENHSESGAGAAAAGHHGPGPHVYAFEGLTPVIDPSAYVHPTAVLIGDVIVGAGCYVGPGAVMRGDFGRIELRRGANLQDNCVVHSRGDVDCVMEKTVTSATALSSMPVASGVTVSSA